MTIQSFAAYIGAALILFVSAPSFAMNGQAQYPIGEILALEGKAFYVGENGKLPMKHGDPIYMNTTLATAQQSRALILFVDNTEITLGENSELTIDEYVFDPYDPVENKGEFSIKGAFSWTSGLLSKRPDPEVTIKTTVGSIGIRGTQFWGGTIDGYYGVYVFDGLVDYSTQSGAVSLKPEDGVRTKDETSPFNTDTWNGDQVRAALKTVAFSKGTNTEFMLKNARAANVSKQHDYRSRMFPYKNNPLQPRLKAKESEFFTEEFEELRGQ